VVAVTVSMGAPAGAQSQLTVILTGQSMIRSDLRASAPAALERMRPLLQGGDVIFTNLEGSVAEPGESAAEGRGFLTPPQALDALQALGFNLLALADNHAFDLKAPGITNTLTETHRRGIVHAGTGASLAEAAAPAYLHLPKLTVALVASASGLIAPDGNATADRPGVNELRIHAGGQANEATADLAGAGANTPDPEDAQRILASIRASVRPRHRVPAQPRVWEPLLRDDLLRGDGGAAGPERVAAQLDACGGGRRRGCRGAARRAAPAWNRDLPRPADLLRSRQLHLQPAADDYLHR
jgi:poly-gamma-glutamate synthesis protein (capsule biosynthesis protein)